MLNHLRTVTRFGFSRVTPIIFKYSKANILPRKGMFGAFVPKFNFAGIIYAYVVETIPLPNLADSISEGKVLELKKSI